MLWKQYKHVLYVFYFGRSSLLTHGTERSVSQWRALKYETRVIFSLLNQRVLDFDPLWCVSVVEHFDSGGTRTSEVRWVVCGVLSVYLKVRFFAILPTSFALMFICCRCKTVAAAIVLWFSSTWHHNCSPAGRYQSFGTILCFHVPEDSTNIFRKMVCAPPNCCCLINYTVWFPRRYYKY